MSLVSSKRKECSEPLINSVIGNGAHLSAFVVSGRGLFQYKRMRFGYFGDQRDDV